MTKIEDILKEVKTRTNEMSTSQKTRYYCTVIYSYSEEHKKRYRSADEYYRAIMQPINDKLQKICRDKGYLL